jgi:hypothetical protein
VTVSANGGGDDPTSEDDEEDSSGPSGNDGDETSLATITITGIRTDFVGKSYTLGLFPEGTKLETMFEGNPLAYGQGKISGATTNIPIFSAGTAWNAPNGSYAVGIMIVTESSSGDVSVAYAGFGTVRLSSKKATIGFSALTDITEQIPDGIELPSGNGKEPGTDYPSDPPIDTGELTSATSWGEYEWSNWFASHSPYDSSSVYAVSQFTSANPWWVQSNPWWDSLCSAWLSAGAGSDVPDGTRTGGTGTDGTDGA